MTPPPMPATICRMCIIRGDEVWLGVFCGKVLFGVMAAMIAGLDRGGVVGVISNKVVYKFIKKYVVCCTNYDTFSYHSYSICRLEVGSSLKL